MGKAPAVLRPLGLFMLAVSLLFLPAASKTLLAADNYVFNNSWLVTPTSFNPSNGIAVDLAGNVYVADTANDQIQKYNSSGVLLNKWGSNGSAVGKFNTPNDVAVDIDGNVYVADTYNDRVQEFNSSGTFIAAWGAYGNGNGQFNKPGGIAVDIFKNIYVADTANNRVQKFNSSHNFAGKFGSPGANSGQFNNPEGIAVDILGNIYVADSSNHRIQLFNTSFNYILKWGAHGTGDGQFAWPNGIDVDLNGNVYVADSGNNRIQKFLAGGIFVTKWGASGSGNGQFYSPNDITVDLAGNVLVIDSHNHRVQKFVENYSFTPAGVWNSAGGAWDNTRDKLTAGDFNSDGYQDIASLRQYPGARRVQIYVWLNDTHGNYGAPSLWWDSGGNTWDWVGVRAAAGNFDKIGGDDLVVFYGYARERQTRAFVFTSNGTSFSNPAVWWDSGPGNWDWAGTHLQVGDYNGDGATDLLAFYGYLRERQARAFVFTTGAAKFNNPSIWWDSGPGNWDIAGTKLASGDFTFDGQDDLLAFYGYFATHQTRAFVFPSTGGAFSNSAVWWDSGPNNWDWAGTKLAVGNFDTALGSDIAALYGYSGNRSRVFVFSANPLLSFFNPPTVWWDSGPGNWSWGASTIFSSEAVGTFPPVDLLCFYNQGGRSSSIYSFH